MKYIERDRKKYPKYAVKRAEKSNALIDTVKAFLVGGAICTVGQLFFEIYARFKIDADLSGHSPQ
jgi:stage V sporulation protein AC